MRLRFSFAMKSQIEVVLLGSEVKGERVRISRGEGFFKESPAFWEAQTCTDFGENIICNDVIFFGKNQFRVRRHLVKFIKSKNELTGGPNQLEIMGVFGSFYLQGGRYSEPKSMRIIKWLSESCRLRISKTLRGRTFRQCFSWLKIQTYWQQKIFIIHSSH